MFNCMVKFIHFQKFNTADTTYKACKMLVLTTIYQLYTIYNTNTIFFGNIGLIYTYNNGVLLNLSSSEPGYTLPLQTA